MTKTKTLALIWRAIRTTSCVLVATALGILSTSALLGQGIVPSPPVTYIIGDLNGQNGWDGGLVGGFPVPFTNNNAGSDVIVNTIAFGGTQSWQYGGSYGSPGAGTPFTPVVATVGAPNATTYGSAITPAGDQSVISFAFKAAASGDSSGFSVYEGSYLRNDRTGPNLYIENDTANGNAVGTVSLYGYTYDCTTDTFPQVNLAALSVAAWHTVEMTTTYPVINPSQPPSYGLTTYVFDRGTLGQQTATLASWPDLWRACPRQGLAYTPGSSVKFSSFFNDWPTHQGFYIDNVSMTVINTATHTTVGHFATGFEATLPIPTNKDQCKDNGWMTLVRADGTPFKNQGDCIQYVNTGK